MNEGELASARTLEIGAAENAGPWVVEVGQSSQIAVEPLGLGHTIVLGSSSRAALRVEDPAVSGVHCELIAERGGIWLRDLASRNGVWLGGARVPQARLLELPASFVIGRTMVTVRRQAEHESSSIAPSLPGLIGNSEPMRRVAEEVRRHAATRVPILIQGESGTGKDVVARAIHELGRPAGPFVPLNVGAIAESLADSELFGHRRGAFTGAVSHRQGAFELAHRGTLFLDEIAELSPSIQVKLLRVVEDGAVRPVGAHAACRVDVRIVSASWALLSGRVAESRFRADLFHRLSTVTVRLPPLRERRSDLPALCRELLRRMRPDVGEKQLSGGALSRLVAHDFPGNVRELSSILYRAAIASRSPVIEPEHLALVVVEPRQRRAAEVSNVDPRLLLDRHRGNVSAAARAARMPRTTFRAWLLRSELKRAAE